MPQSMRWSGPTGRWTRNRLMEIEMPEKMLRLLMLVMVFSAFCDGQRNYCGTTMFNSTSGFVYSPNWPSYYETLLNCTYNVYASSLSNISLTFTSFDVEYQARCTYDWLEVSCESHRIGLPKRFCGQSVPAALSYSPCTHLVLWFSSDSSVIRPGFSIYYEVNEIGCIGNCTPVSNANGYVCPCDTVGINSTVPNSTPSPDCPSSCLLSPDDSYCSCAEATTTTPFSSSTCPPGCYTYRDFSGRPSCNCYDSTTPNSGQTCSPGCYRTTDWSGNPTCNCPPSSSRPITCPYGCFQDSDYWGNQYCNCPESTQAPIWCQPGCTSAVSIYGYRYCDCPTTTMPPCFSPCYYSWDYTYDFSGRRICYCPPTTTQPPPTGCNQTLTSSFGTVVSPNYPNTYPRPVDCIQTISVQGATSIRLKLIDLNLYYYDSNACGYDYIEITGCDGSYNIYCTSYNFPTAGLEFQCTGSYMVTVNLHSSQTSYYSSYRGFKLSYSSKFVSNCSDSGSYISQGTKGSITSPNYPNDFPASSECFNYLFTDDDNLKIMISVDQLKLEDSTTCKSSFLKFTCQDDIEQSAQVCGVQTYWQQTFDCKVLQIWFKSNSTLAFSPRFFIIRYYGVPNSQSSPSPQQYSGGRGQSDISDSAKLGIGLGVGIGGFFLLLLIILIIVIFASSQRQATNRERHRMDDLAVICRAISCGRSDVGGNIMVMTPRQSDGGFVNPLHPEDTASGGRPPSYKSAGGIAFDPTEP